jgi:hypothetical protein
MLRADIHMAAFADNLRKQYDDVFIILSPPRCSSTALARVFWECPAVSFYCHEPFDIVYHRHAFDADALRTLEIPIDLKLIKKASCNSRGLLIKEMTFQLGDRFEHITTLTTRPVIFLIRDPRLSIHSRSRLLKKAGLSSHFPLVETGWSHLENDISMCIEQHIPYVIVRSVDLRNHPAACICSLFERLGISSTQPVLNWRSLNEIVLGGISDQQRNWYQRVLSSTCVEPEESISPEIEDFARDPYFADHIAACMQIYDRLQGDDHLVRLT